MLAALTELCAARFAMPPLPAARAEWLREYAGAARRAGRAALVLSADEAARLAAAGVDWPPAARSDELWRVTLLVGAAAADDFAALVADCYRTGDNDERCAVLRALPLCQAPERFVRLAVEACRSSVQPIFEAVACDNPLPARHFPEANFNQMVLKALFVGVPLARVVGLGGRLGPELARMAHDYAAERRAAGRPVPDDLALLCPGSQP